MFGRLGSHEHLLGSPALAKAAIRRRRVLPISLWLLAVAMSSYLTYTYVTGQTRLSLFHERHVSTSPLGQSVLPHEGSRSDRLPSRFRDSLQKDSKYITSWVDSGFTNDVMSQSNLLYLAKITQRIPILPPFSPNARHFWLDKHPPTLPFGEVYDISWLSKAMQMPILEWQDVKNLSNPELEALGCWSLFETQVNGLPRESPSPNVAGLDISYTRTPDSTKWRQYQPVTDWWSLAALSYPEEHRRVTSGAVPRPSTNLSITLPPDEQLLCFDFLYYAGADGTWEYRHEWSPAWHNVMKHMRWTKRIDDLVDDALRTVLSLPHGAAIPPIISVHVRHGDFIFDSNLCGADIPPEKCFAPLSAWHDAVEEVRADLLKQKGVDAKHVVVTSDETDPVWWAEVASFGWTAVNHTMLRTEEKYNVWYPVLIDAAIQSRGKGFVGTEDSTMSILALRRVKEWNDGVGKQLRRISL